MFSPSFACNFRPRELQLQLLPEVQHERPEHIVRISTLCTELRALFRLARSLHILCAALPSLRPCCVHNWSHPFLAITAPVLHFTQRLRRDIHLTRWLHQVRRRHQLQRPNLSLHLLTNPPPITYRRSPMRVAPPT